MDLIKIANKETYRGRVVFFLSSSAVGDLLFARETTVGQAHCDVSDTRSEKETA